MWDNIVLVLVGAAIPIFINWLQRKEERKKFDLQRKDKYKLVAIEKRLEAHQQAFFHWNKLATIIHENDSDIRQSILESARDFYFKNALYLEKKTRHELYDVISKVASYPTTLQIWRKYDHGPEKNEAHQNLVNDYNAIRALGNVIQNDVNLESINMATKETPEGHTEKER